MAVELVYLERDGETMVARSERQAKVLQKSGWTVSTAPPSTAAEAEEGEPLGVLTNPSDDAPDDLVRDFGADAPTPPLPPED